MDEEELGAKERGRKGVKEEREKKNRDQDGLLLLPPQGLKTGTRGRLLGSNNGPQSLGPSNHRASALRRLQLLPPASHLPPTSRTHSQVARLKSLSAGTRRPQPRQVQSAEPPRAPLRCGVQELDEGEQTPSADYSCSIDENREPSFTPPRRLDPASSPTQSEADRRLRKSWQVPAIDSAPPRISPSGPAPSKTPIEILDFNPRLGRQPGPRTLTQAVCSMLYIIPSSVSPWPS